MQKVKKVVLAGLLLAVLIIFARFVSVQYAVLRLSFGYIPLILSGWLLGPLWTAVIGALGDILGMLLLPKGAYFPGFTLSEILTGLLYGFFLYGRPVDRRMLLRLVLPLTITVVCVNLALNTLWLAIMLKKAFLVVAAGRLAAEAVKLPVEIASMFLIMKFLEKPVRTYLWNNAGGPQV
jgi:ECF transporter S component (folate family)